MCRLKDLTGKKYGRLTVLSREPNNKHGESRWKCQCQCGNIVVVNASSLKSGATKSCGCFWKEKMSKHNMYGTRIYCIWDGMKSRCYNKNHHAYFNYGGRGIKVCDEWLDKEKGIVNFYNWAIQNGYKENLSIDRIDVNGNYEPNNCRWLDNKTQSNNKRNCCYITYNNKTHTVAEWAEILKIDKRTLYSRFFNNWSIEKALITPVRKRRK